MSCFLKFFQLSTLSKYSLFRKVSPGLFRLRAAQHPPPPDKASSDPALLQEQALGVHLSVFTTIAIVEISMPSHIDGKRCGERERGKHTGNITQPSGSLATSSNVASRKQRYAGDISCRRKSPHARGQAHLASLAMALTSSVPIKRSGYELKVDSVSFEKCHRGAAGPSSVCHRAV